MNGIVCGGSEGGKEDASRLREMSQERSGNARGKRTFKFQAGKSPRSPRASEDRTEERGEGRNGGENRHRAARTKVAGDYALGETSMTIPAGDNYTILAFASMKGVFFCILPT